MRLYGRVTRIWEPGRRRKIWSNTGDGEGYTQVSICIYVSRISTNRRRGKTDLASSRFDRHRYLLCYIRECEADLGERARNFAYASIGCGRSWRSVWIGQLGMRKSLITRLAAWQVLTNDTDIPYRYGEKHLPAQLPRRR